MSMICRVLLVVFFVALMTPPPVVAQQLRIAGTVDDGTGVLSEALVILRAANGASVETTTDRTGQFQFDGLRPGTYDLTVTRAGYAAQTRSVVLGADSQVIPVRLEVEGVSVSVEVTGVGTGALSTGLSAPTTAGSRLDLTSLETPASVMTLSGADIRLRGDNSVNAAVTRAVGITTTYSIAGGGNTVAARGFSGGSVAYMYDGIRNMAGLGNVGWPFDPWTVERIEVLNGPASVLYGIGSIGASINIVPRRPTRNRQNTIRIAGGSFNTYRYAMDSTGPISDRVLYRVDVSRQQSNGYIDRGDSSSTAVSGSVAFLASDRLKFTVMNDWAMVRPMIYNGTPMVNGVTREDLRRENYATSDADVHFNENSTRVEMDWTARPGMSVRNVASVLRADRRFLQGPPLLLYRPATNDVSRGSYADFTQDQTQFNNQIEVLFRGRIGGLNNTFVVGGDGERLGFTRYVTTWPGVSTVVSLVDPVQGVHPATGGVTGTGATHTVTRFSVFAEDRLALTPALSLVTGFRFDRQHVHRLDRIAQPNTSVERTYTPASVRVGGVYAVRPNTNIYAQFSNATDAIANVVSISAAQLIFDPTRGRQVEAGVKQSVLGGRMEWTLAGYRIVKHDLLIPDPNRPATQIQVGQQSSRGVEVALAAEVGGGLRVGINGTVLTPRYDDFFETVGGVRTSRIGNRPTTVPSKSANMQITWGFASNWFAQAVLRYVGDRDVNTANTQKLPAYSVVDTSLRVPVSRRVGIDLRVSNLFDAFYAFNSTSNGAGGGNWNLGAPRSFEAVLTAGF